MQVKWSDTICVFVDSVCEGSIFQTYIFFLGGGADFVGEVFQNFGEFHRGKLFCGDCFSNEFWGIL